MATTFIKGASPLPSASLSLTSKCPWEIFRKHEVINYRVHTSNLSCGLSVLMGSLPWLVPKAGILAEGFHVLSPEHEPLKTVTSCPSKVLSLLSCLCQDLSWDFSLSQSSLSALWCAELPQALPLSAFPILLGNHSGHALVSTGIMAGDKVVWLTAGPCVWVGAPWKQSQAGCVAKRPGQGFQSWVTKSSYLSFTALALTPPTVTVFAVISRAQIPSLSG